MPNFPTSDPTLLENYTDATASATNHAAAHNAVNDEVNAIGAEYLDNAIRKNVLAVMAEIFAVANGKKTFLGRGDNLTNLFDSAVVEIDARTTVGGHPGPGWPANTSALWLLGDDQGTAALLKFHVAGAHEVIYVSHPDGQFMLKAQPNAPFNAWQVITGDGAGGFAVRQAWRAGDAAGSGYIEMVEFTDLKGGARFGATGDTLLVNRVLGATAVWAPGSLADGAMASTTLTVTGAVVGNPVVAGHTTTTAAGWVLAAHVSAADTVRVNLLNHTGGTLDPGSGTLTVTVLDVEPD